MCQRLKMAVKNAEAVLKDIDLKNCPPQLCKGIMTASCLSCPSDPIQFLKDTLLALQGNDNLQTVDWYKLVADLNQHTAASVSRRKMDKLYMGPGDNTVDLFLLEKASSFYRKSLTSYCFRKWKRFTVQSKAGTTEPVLTMDMAKEYFEKKCLQDALNKWLNWVTLQKEAKAAAIKKLETLVNSWQLRRIVVKWHRATKDTRNTKEHFKEMYQRLEMSFRDVGHKDRQTGEGHDGLSALPSSLSLKIFQYLELRDRLNCAAVCCTWKSIIQTGTLWSQINFSAGKDWITDSTVKHILQSFQPFVTHLNLRGCTSLKWPSLKCISVCRNLQELNVSECCNVTDMLVQNIVEGCPCLLYLNLSYTLITNKTLRDLSRSCFSLQYLSLAYCNRFTDKGFLYLTTGKGWRNLIHLDLSGCTQMTVNGFRYIAAGCPALREIVINDMPTLSDGCILALLAKCHCLSAISLLDSPHLSDVAFKAIAQAAKLKTFSTEGNNQLTDVSWKALCSSSQGLRRLHAAECPRMTDLSLRSVASLKNLQYLDISFCSRVSDLGILYLTKGPSANKLKELNVSHCTHITDTSVISIAQRLCKLYHLDVSYCERLTDSAVEWLSGSSIYSLDISGCNIQDQGLATLEGIRLKKLVLAECVYVTDAGIEKLCKNVRDLEHVDVSHCAALTDAAVRSFAFYCRGLFTLRMSGCPKMTDMAVQYLTSGSQYLRELDVSGCILLTDRTIRHLERMCPPLCSITMACCIGISRAAALKLQSRVAHWEHSNDDPTYRFGQIVHPITHQDQ